MKIFLSYGHDANAPLVEKIKEYLSKDSDGKPKHEVWIDTSEIKAGNDWRDSITDGIMHSDVVLAGLSEHSTRNPGVCRDELSISIGVMGGNIKPVLLEPADVVAAPAMLSHIQWVDMSEWKQHAQEGFDSIYFQEKFKEIAEMIDTPENERYNGDITRLKDKLHPISSLSRIQSLTKKRMYGRQWLYEKIEGWDKADEQRIFWIVGGPGFGKSTFAANLQKSKYCGKIPAIQFVEWGKPDHSNPCNILRNLAFQLAVRYPDYMRFVLALPQLDNLINMNENELFDILFCESAFLKIDGDHESVWFLIDALDEANDEYDNKIAQTIARHIDRMPKWIKFILTSRDDSKVRLPLQKYKPQVFDLEEYVKTKNDEDLQLYLRGELASLNPTEEQIQKILNKGQGVFLYLSLCVEGILNGTYSLNELDKLPDGLNGYYYEFFTRQFGNDITFYKKEVRPILQILVASTSTMTIPFLKYVSGIESDTEFNEILLALNHICRVQVDYRYDKHYIENDKYVTQQTKKITLFHNSIENWLTNPEVSGVYFISRNDGKTLLAERFNSWLKDTGNENNSLWLSYGTKDLAKQEGIIDGKNIEKMQVLLDLARNDTVGLGAMTKIVNHYQELIFQYCTLSLGDEQDLLNFFIDMFEATKNRFIEINLISASTRTYKCQDIDVNPQKLLRAAYASAVVGSTSRFVVENIKTVTPKSACIFCRILEVLAFYNYRLSEQWSIEWKRPSSLEDMCYFTAMELDGIAELFKSQYAMPSNEKTGEHYQLALAQRHPELYPTIEIKR